MDLPTRRQFSSTVPLALRKHILVCAVHNTHVRVARVFSSRESHYRNYLTARSKMNSSLGVVFGGIFALVVAGYIAQSRLPPPKPKIMGIDPGTTFSCVGVYQAVTGHVDILANKNGSKVIPSVVAFTDNGVLVGNRALAQAELKPRSSIYDAKRFTGKKFSKDDLRKLSTLYQFRVTLMKRTILSS